MCSGLSADDLAMAYPTLFHMAAEGSWPLIERLGLLSTSALLDCFEVPEAVRSALEERHRPNSVSIHHPTYGQAIIRDQKPMDDRGLERALRDGLTPRDWYRVLNAKVFFWVQRHRLEIMMKARAYQLQRKTVLYVRTAELLRRYADRVLLAAMNTGCTKPWPHPRGINTFRPMAEYPYCEYRKKKGPEAVVELAVEGKVPDIRDLVERVEIVSPDGSVEVLVER